MIWPMEKIVTCLPKKRHGRSNRFFPIFPSANTALSHCMYYRGHLRHIISNYTERWLPKLRKKQSTHTFMKCDLACFDMNDRDKTLGTIKNSSISKTIFQCISIPTRCICTFTSSTYHSEKHLMFDDFWKLV